MKKYGKKNLHAERGLIKQVVLIIAVLLILVYFGLDIRKILTAIVDMLNRIF